MNNRQKAKHFKQLYELHLAKTIPVKIVHEELKHYTAGYQYNERRDSLAFIEDEKARKEIIANEIIRKLQPKLRENLEEPCIDPETGTEWYRIDIWLRR